MGSLSWKRELPLYTFLGVLMHIIIITLIIMCSRFKINSHNILTITLSGKAEKPVKPPKPALPNRPEKLKNSQRASVSPPNKNPALSPSPPLLPPPNVKKEMNPHISEVNSHTPDQDATSDHYTALSELSTQHTGNNDSNSENIPYCTRNSCFITCTIDLDYNSIYAFFYDSCS